MDDMTTAEGVLDWVRGKGPRQCETLSEERRTAARIAENECLRLALERNPDASAKELRAAIDGVCPKCGWRDPHGFACPGRRP